MSGAGAAGEEPGAGERTIYLIDGTSNLFRAFHAIPHLSNSAGIPTNAVYGFTGMLRSLIQRFAPRYMAIAFDLAGPTFRHRLYQDYKANRAETPDDLIAQIPWVKKVCGVLRAPVVELEGFEADDLIGTLARKARGAGFQVIVVASDKDLLQLVGEGIRVFNPISERLLDSEGVERQFGARPDQVADVLALWGDSSDNIPGVPGIGEKGAKQLIAQFDTLEEALRRASEVKRPQYRDGLLAHADAARLSRRLATLRLDVPIDFDPETFRLLPPDPEAARGLFRELEFGGLEREFSAPPRAVDAGHEIVERPERLREIVAALRAAGVVALDVQRDRPEPMLAEALGLVLAGEGIGACYVPLAALDAASRLPMDRAEVLRIAAPLLADPAVRRIGHDAKGCLVLLRRLAQDAGDFEFDSMLASYLLDPSRRDHTIEAVASEVAGLVVPSGESLFGAGARRVAPAAVGVEPLAAFACSRLSAVVAVRRGQLAGLERHGLLPLLTEIELPLTGILADMERRGIAIDAPFLEQLSAGWQTDLEGMTTAIHRQAGREFNLNSPRQIADLLFNVLKLQPGRRTRKTRSLSTGAEVLEELAAAHELPRRLLEYRSLQKLKSTYVDALPRLINPVTGRVHTSFNQAVAATGRLSSSDPNLQNIPIRSAAGRQIRRAFVPSPGHLLLSADYSQIELRVLAHLCGDPDLVDAFARGEDIHRRTAAELFGVMPELVTAEMRRRAKAVNFGIIYGMGAQRLAREQAVTLKEASGFIRRYFERFPKVKAYVDGTIAAAERDGSVRTLFGRIRYLPEIRGSDRNLRQQALRAAVNTTIQGTAADLIKKAMVMLADRLRTARLRGAMVLQVHDELVLEVPAGEEGRTATILRRVMEGVHPLSVPLTVDLAVGGNWLDMSPLEPSDA
jgi:DNA polymerase-1